MTHLDDPGLLALDASGMLRHIAGVGAELVRAWAQSADLALPVGAADATSVVVAGMGGSATAADYFAAVCAPIAPLPITVIRDYSLPAFVSRRTLVVISSYSGDTEEVLSCYDDARRRGAMILAITTGGELASRAAADGVPVHAIRYASPPRAATVHTLAPLLAAGSRLGWCTIETADIERAGERHRAFVEEDLAPWNPQERNGAKQLAMAVRGRTPLILSGGHLAVTARRFQNQLAENGKAMSAVATLPEANHNLIVGLETAPTFRDTSALVTIETMSLVPAPIRWRFDMTAQLFAEAGVPVHRFEAGGDTILDQLLQATAWGDFVSFYLALSNGVDPTPIPQIERLKAANAKEPAR